MLILYGSAARGTMKAISAIDRLVVKDGIDGHRRRHVCFHRNGADKRHEN